MRLLARFLPFFFFFAFSEPQFLQQKNKRLSGSSVGAIPVLTHRAVSVSLPPTSPCSLPFFHLPIIYSFSRQLFIEYLLYCRCRKHNRLTSKQVSSTDSQSAGSVFVQTLLCPLFHQSILQVILCLEQEKKRKKCAKSLFPCISVWLYTHTHLYLTFAAALSWEPFFGVSGHEGCL